MKFLSLSILAGLAAASPIAAPGGCSSAPSAPSTCTIAGFHGVVPQSELDKKLAVFTTPGSKDPEVCRARCYSAEYPSCKSFAVRYSSTSNGACFLWDYALTPREPRPTEVSNYYFYNLPAGIVGWVPENVAQHYKADISKTKGNYKDCRALCISEPACKGFGFKNGGNCQLYDVSLTGKVKAKADSPYIHYELDCTADPLPIIPV